MALHGGLSQYHQVDGIVDGKSETSFFDTINLEPRT